MFRKNFRFILTVAIIATTTITTMFVTTNMLSTQSNEYQSGSCAINTRAIDTDIYNLAQSANAFSLDLYKQLSSNNRESICASPYSVFSALAMVYAGAHGTTEQEMAQVLHNTTSQAFHKGCQALRNSLQQNDESYRLNIANKLFLQEEFPVLDAFRSTINSYHDAAFESINFNDPVQASAQINNWVSSKTNDMIPEIVSSGDIKPHLTKLILANAIYFKGQWEHPFAAGNTYPAPFFAEEYQPVEVSMMNQTNRFNYMETDNFQMLELPYATSNESKLSMLVILPTEIDDLHAVEQQLTENSLNQYISELQQQKVVTSLPKFSFDASYSLNDHLCTMGMPSAFDPATANFSGITESSDLFISKVVHKARIEVDEEGSKAAAATAVIMEMRAVSFKTPLPTIFYADHPFIFIIMDRQTNTILFVGRVIEPK